MLRGQLRVSYRSPPTEPPLATLEVTKNPQAAAKRRTSAADRPQTKRSNKQAQDPRARPLDPRAPYNQSQPAALIRGDRPGIAPQPREASGTSVNRNKVTQISRPRGSRSPGRPRSRRSNGRGDPSEHTCLAVSPCLWRSRGSHASQAGRHG